MNQFLADYRILYTVISREWIIITDYQVHVLMWSRSWVIFLVLKKKIVHLFVNIIYLFKLLNILEWFVLKV